MNSCHLHLAGSNTDVSTGFVTIPVAFNDYQLFDEATQTFDAREKLTAYAQQE